jgi:hypothetical protein
MLTDFAYASAQIEHRGAKGREREALVVKKYWNRYLPRSVRAIHGAEILDSFGSRSAECDVVVQDASTPPLYLGETFRLIPVEWAHGIIEVKSRLDAAELDDSHAKIARAKSLRKITYEPQSGDIRWDLNAYGKRFDHFPMYGAVFAYTGIDLSRLARRLWELQQNTPIETWIDIVVVLDRDILFYSDPTQPNLPGNVRPAPQSNIRVVTSEQPLIPATLAMLTAFGAVFMPPARLGPYVGPSAWGEVAEIVGET